MKKMTWKRVQKLCKQKWNKYGQTGLAVVAGITAIGAVVSAIKAAPKAAKIKEDREAAMEEATECLKNGDISQEDFKKTQRDVNIQAAKEYALNYGMTAVFLTLNLGVTAIGYKISIGKQAALLGAYKALEVKHEELLEKAKEVVGEKKLDAIKSEIVKDHIKEADIDTSKIKEPEYEVGSDGNPVNKPYDYPCWDDYSGRPFMMNTTKIDIAMQKASRYCYGNESITVNEIYEYLGGEAVGLHPTGAGKNHGFISNDLNGDCMIPYRTVPIKVEGYDHSFIALVFDKEPALLGWD